MSGPLSFAAADAEDTLERDADFASHLERANYAPGMMLDVATIREEQDFHRRRLNRHRYWLHGAGTVAGLAVGLQAEEPENATEDSSVVIVVGAGVAIDGLGRDVLVATPHCLDLLEWISADGRDLDALRDGLDTDANLLRLTVSVRHDDCPTAMRPVLARRVNAGTDAVDYASIRDAALIEIAPGAVPERGEHFWPWPALPRPPGDALDRINDVERAAVEAMTGDARVRAELQARIIYGLGGGSAPLDTTREPDEIAPVPLAEVRVDLRPDGTPFVHPDHVTVDNLVRAMVPTAAQLAWLAASEE